jgi:hypothetical protein
MAAAAYGALIAWFAARLLAGRANGTGFGSGRGNGPPNRPVAVVTGAFRSNLLAE